MKIIYSIIFLISSSFIFQHYSFAQGGKPLSKSELEKIPKSSVIAGFGDIDRSHIIADSQFPTPGNQGNYWDCVGFAVGYATQSFYENNLKHQLPNSNSNICSYSYVYDLLRKCASCRCGMKISDFLDYLKQYGNVSVRDYSNVCATPEGGKFKNIESQHRISDYFSFSTTNLNDIKGDLLNDIPIIVCIPVNDSFKLFKNKTDNDIFTFSGSYDEDLEFHAVVLTGYDEDKHAFRIINSYGMEWGAKGFGWVNYSTFRKMMIASDNTGYYIVNPTEKIVAGAGQDLVGDKYSKFHPYVYQQTLKKDKYLFTSGFEIEDGAENRVLKIEYFYDTISFANRHALSYKKPNFENSYIGSGCLTKVRATVFMTDHTSFDYSFNACQLIATPLVAPNILQKRANIYAFGSAEVIDNKHYNFKIQLTGIETLKDEIREVVYDRNDATFAQRFQISKDKDSNFESSYIGWGCLDHVLIIVYFKDNSTKVIDFNMCKYLGWD